MDRNAIIRERFNELKERIIVKLIYIAAVLTLIAFSVPSMVVIRNVYNGHTPKIWWIGYQTPTPTENLVDKKMLEAIQETYWVKIQRKAAAVYKSVAMGGSFCADTTVSKFPLGNSLPGKLEPWVMDAVFSEGGSIATVILLERMRCSFSQKDWELAKKTAKSFGSSKDLIELESEGKVYIQSPETSLQFGSSGKSRSDFRKNVAWKVICKYYDRRSKLIGSVESLLILYQSVVRCPVPQDVRRLRKVDDRINLRLQLPDWSSLKETLEDGVASEKNKTSFIRSIARHMEAQLPLTKQFGICSTPSLKGKQLLEFFNSKTNSATDEEHRLLNESEMPSSSKQLSNNSLTIRNNDSHLRSESRQLMLIPKKKSPESMYRRDVMKKSKRKHIYNLAVCSALSPPYSSRRIIEWIEYHRLMGVEHFFLYDKFHPQLWSEDSESINSSTNRTIAKTGSSSMKSVRKASKYLRKSSTISRKLTAIFRNSTVSVEDDDEGEVRERIKKSMQLKPVLQDYIAMGLVTVISWPYAGCTETMRCETGIRIKRSPTDPVSGYTKVFYPPKPLYSAELSCYHRFRSTSRWIAMLDDDREFIGIDSKKRCRLLFILNLSFTYTFIILQSEWKTKSECS